MGSYFFPSPKHHYEQKDHDFASSRSYYAVFYAMQAVLLTEGLTFSKHTGVISAFNLKFIRTGIFPKEFSKLTNRLFRERQTGDYQFDLVINENDAKIDIEIAVKILKAIQTYLIQKKLIKQMVLDFQ